MKSPPQKEALRDDDVVFVCLFVCLFVCRLKRVLVWQWLTSQQRWRPRKP